MSQVESVSSSLQLGAISGEYASRQFSELLDLAFGVPSNMRFLDDFPVWDPIYSINNVMRWGMFQGHQLLATTAIRKTQIFIPSSGPVDIAILGGVTTRPDWRGHGLASKLISRAVQWAKDHQARAVLLWGADSKLYQNLGFSKFGQQIRVPLSKAWNEGDQFSINTGWNPKIFPLLQSRKEGLILNSEDLKWYEAHKNVKWFWIGSPGESPRAYAALDRGIDLGNIVHEWGGGQKELHSLLCSIRRLHPEANLLCSPDHLQKLGIQGRPGLMSHLMVEDLGLVRILDSKLKSEFLDHLWVWGLDAA